MLFYYNVHVSDSRGKFSRFPEHRWVASSMIYAFLSDKVFFNWVYKEDWNLAVATMERHLLEHNF